SRSSNKSLPAIPDGVRVFIARCRLANRVRLRSNFETPKSSIQSRPIRTSSAPGASLFLFVDWRDFAELPFDRPASVVLFHAAGFSVSIFGNNVGFEVTADCLAALDAQSRMRQDFQPFCRDRI